MESRLKEMLQKLIDKANALDDLYLHSEKFKTAMKELWATADEAQALLNKEVRREPATIKQ